jgi:hypothetical protein
MAEYCPAVVGIPAIVDVDFVAEEKDMREAWEMESSPTDFRQWVRWAQ